MSATVAAALKKIAVYILTDKKALKVVGGIVLGIIIIIVMPIVAVLSIFNGNLNIDTDRLQTMVVENMSAEQQAKLQFVEDTMYGIEDKMLEAEYTTKQVKEAQVLYVLVLSENAKEDGFIDRLVSCFSVDQTHEALIRAINAEFGTNIVAEEFSRLMASIQPELITVAYSQIGNVGGEPYWLWYGFESRVEWCACFVSWCANESGQLTQGTIPKFALCTDGVNWFKNKNAWLDGSETPSPGMIIFFDWASDGQDGNADHVGIVAGVENGRVITVEGNSSDSCRERSYAVGHYEILGYGMPDEVLKQNTENESQ